MMKLIVMLTNITQFQCCLFFNLRFQLDMAYSIRFAYQNNIVWYAFILNMVIGKLINSTPTHNTYDMVMMLVLYQSPLYVQIQHSQNLHMTCGPSTRYLHYIYPGDAHTRSTLAHTHNSRLPQNRLNHNRPT